MTYPLIQNHTYDSLNRLDDASETSNGTQTWRQDFSYDRYGNRNFVEPNTSFAGFDKLCNSNTELCATLRRQLNPGINSGNNNRMNSGQDYTYDSAGNTLTDANGQTFIYDGENKQVEVRNSSNAAIGKYWYDGDGLRVKKEVPGTGEVTIFVYDAAGKQIAEYSTVVASANDAKVAYLTADHLGSPRINTDVTGAVSSRHDYHPFGEEIDGTGGRTTGLNYGSDTVRKQFTGYEWDIETDLDFAQARYHNFNLGRFNSVDPILDSMDTSMPQSMNRYAYVLNNPLFFVDPDGELWVKNEKPEYGRTDEYYWIDECGKGQTCYEALAVSGKYGVTVYGSNDFQDITIYQANKDGVIDVRKLSQHHNAEFIVADGQNVPEEFLSTESATALFNVAKYYSEVFRDDDKLVFTAGAASNGKPGVCGKSPCHSGHAGVDIDLRYMGSDGRPIQGDTAYANADIGRTNMLIATFKDNGHPTSYTGDNSRFGQPDKSPKYRDNTEKVHRHHLHVGRTRPKSK